MQLQSDDGYKIQEIDIWGGDDDEPELYNEELERLAKVIAAGYWPTLKGFVCESGQITSTGAKHILKAITWKSHGRIVQTSES